MKTIPTEFPKQKPTEFPFKAIRGNATATIYLIHDAKGDCFRVPYQEAGLRKFHRFPEYDAACDKGNDMLKQLERGNVDAVTLTNSDKLIYTTALGILKPFGLRLDAAAQIVADSLKALDGCPVSPVEACKAHAKRHPANMPDKSVVEVVAEFIKAKEAKKRSRRHIEDLRYRLGQPEVEQTPGQPALAKKDAHGFSDAFKGSIGHIDGSQIQAYLDGLNLSSRSYNNYRGAIGSLFRFAVAHKYLPADWNELKAVDEATDNGGKIEIFTPEEITALLSKASSELKPFLAIGAFAGLRSAEIDRLEWQDVKFATGYIVVEKDKAKTAARRVVPMIDNLKAWLAPYANATGKVWPHGHAYLYEVLEGVTKAAKVPWKPNALRHSYISYRVAETGNVNATALEAGNSPAMIFSNYRELVTPEDAKQWFAIKPVQKQPKHSRKIITFATQTRKASKAQVQTVAVKA